MRHIIALCVGIVLLSVGVVDWADLLPKIGLPARELSNPWIIADLRTLRGACVIFATGLVFSTIILWNAPDAITKLADKVEISLSRISRRPFFVPLCLVILVLAKTILQLRLYVIGYA